MVNIDMTFQQQRSTHWGWYFAMTFWNTFFIIFVPQFKFHWNLFLRVQLTITGSGNGFVHHCFRYWLVSGLATSQYLNQCWNIVDSNLSNIFQWNSYIFIQENAFENAIAKWWQICLSLNVLTASRLFSPSSIWRTLQCATPDCLHTGVQPVLAKWRRSLACLGCADIYGQFSELWQWAVIRN